MVDPKKANLPVMSREDYLDSFSTLFALKAPRERSGIETRMLSLSRLLAYVVDAKRGPMTAPKQPAVFVVDGKGGYVQSRIPAARPSER